MRSPTLVAAAALAAGAVSGTPVEVRANGGPVEWTTAAGGGLAPIDVDVGLDREDLRIVVADDARHYDVTAVYRLVNPGKRRAITFGVPVEWRLADDGTGGGEPDGEARALARSVAIELAGRRVGCALTGPVVTIGPDGGATGGAAADRIDVPRLLSRSAWCTAPITVPAGRSTLTLRYRGQLLYEDMETSKSPLVDFDLRRIHYPLFPAGAWRGPVRSLHARVELGPLAGLVDRAFPAGATTDGDALVWHLEDVDLDQTRTLLVEADARPVLFAREIARWHRTHDLVAVTATRASSHLPRAGARRYGPARAADGDPATAWCEGVAGDGVGQWVEVEIGGDPDTIQQCRPSTPALIPGYARTASTWRRNGRATRVRVERCGGGGPGYEVALAPGRFDRSAARLSPTSAEDATIFDDAATQLASEGRLCLRFTIVAVEPGASGDTCLSELVPIINCG